MACPSSGTITIQDLVDEFGGSTPHSLSEYYRDGGEVPGNNTNVPTSGTISLSNFYSAVNEIQQTYSSNATNLNLSSVFGGNWSSSVPKRVTVNSGVTIGGTNTHAILIPSGMGGTLIIDNHGDIIGYGGSRNGGGGGHAIYAQHTSGVTVNNKSGGEIYAGGGGGGAGGTGGSGGSGGSGGTGGQGSYWQQVGNGRAPNSGSFTGWNYASGQCGHNCGPGDNNCDNLHGVCKTYYSNYGGGCSEWQASGHDSNSGDWGSEKRVEGCKRKYYTSGGSGGGGGSGGSGGSGGYGGKGRGYNQSQENGGGGSGGSNGSGGSGGGSGGSGAGNGGSGGSGGQGGTGGTGGAGGGYGSNGNNGSTGNTGSGGSTGNSGGNGNHSNGSGGSGGSSGSGGSGGSGGGSAGYYIYNRGSITFNNSGSVAGN